MAKYNDKELAETSKFLSFVLRHKPEAIGIVLDREGWADIDDAPRDKSPHIREINDTVAAFQYLQKNYNFMYQYQNSWSLKWVILAFEAIQSLVLTRD